MMRARRHRLLVLALVVAGAPRGAQATPRNELTIAAALDSAYDDNVYNGRGPDFVNRINPYASWRLIDPRVKLDVRYDLGYWTYALGKAENSLNHRAHIAVEGRVTRLFTLAVSDEFIRAEDPGFLTRMGVVAPQIGIIDNIADVLGSVSITRRLYASLGYTFHHTSFDNFTAEQVAAGAIPLFDGDEHDAQLAAGYRVTRADDFHLAGRVQVFTAGPQNVSAERWAIGASYAPTAGWRHLFFPALEASIDAGPVFYQSLSDAVNVPAAPGSGVTWRLGTNIRYVTPTWRASIAYTHDLLGATGLGSAIWADYVYAQVGYHWLERLDASIGFGYFRNGRAVDQPAAYDGLSTDVLVDVRVVNNFRVGAYYTLRWQETGPGAIPPGLTAAQFPDVTRNIVGVRLLAVLGADARPPRREVKE